jgi:hypothetical protein
MKAQPRTQFQKLEDSVEPDQIYVKVAATPTKQVKKTKEELNDGELDWRMRCVKVKCRAFTSEQPPSMVVSSNSSIPVNKPEIALG